MARKQFACDFEATTDPDDCRVWGWGYMEIGNEKNHKIGHKIDDFMLWVQKAQADLYFHNLKYDGSFIVNWLLKHDFKHDDSGQPFTFQTTISSMGQWYMIDICFGYKGKRKLHTVVYDSLKKLPFKISEIAKGFKLDQLKGDIDYHKYRPKDYVMTDEEYDYIYNDIYILASALDIQISQGLNKMTIGSDSLSGFKTIISKKQFERLYPVLDLHADTEIRKAYRGGFTWLKDDYKRQELGECISFDVNSLYPSVMYDKPLPYGVPKMFDGEYEYDEEYPLYIQHMKCEFELKDKHIPIIQLKNNPAFKQNEYLKSSEGEQVELYVTNVDLDMIQEHYHLFNIEYVDGFKFRQMTGAFKQYIDKWTYVKVNNTGAKKLLAKLMLNNLYGKFASNPDVTGKEPVLNEDGSLSFVMGEEEYKDPVYTPMGVFITSWARYVTITSAQQCYDRIIYCDTDSIHLTGTTIPDTIKHLIDDDKLGYWAWEGTYKRCKYIRQKTYIQDVYINDDGDECERDEATDTKRIVKCAGMPESVKDKVTWENFDYGFRSKGKLVPKQVDGGVVLVDREYTLKEVGI